MSNVKELVLDRFLDFVSRFIPLNNAILATLGGYGIEAKVWARRGLPHNNGWLIERSQSRGVHLIASYRYHYHNQLKSFPQMLGGVIGSHAAVDGFHLDLCGTMSNRVLADFKPAFDLVLRGNGRSLAVTVSDQRRNVLLENWPHLIGRAKRILPGFWKILLEAMQDEQLRLSSRQSRSRTMPAFIKPFDPDKGAKREFGLLVELAELFSLYNVACSSVERFVYVSRYSGRSFRMRTYFFHFDPKGSKGNALDLARMWTESLLYQVDARGFTMIPRSVGTTAATMEYAQTTQTKLSVAQTSKTMIKSKLQQLVELASSEIVAEYASLLADAKVGRAVRAAVETERTSEAPLAPPVEPESVLRPTRKYTRSRTLADMTDAEEIQWMFKMLELRVQNGNVWQNGAWKAQLSKDFGRYSARLGKSCRGALARTGGKFRKMFEAKIRKVFPGDSAQLYLDRLAKLPSHT